MKNGWPVGSCPQFYHIIVIPEKMRQDILHGIHEGHLGVEKCKRRARDTVFWPGINKDIEKLISRCDTSKTQEQANQRACGGNCRTNSAMAHGWNAK